MLKTIIDAINLVVLIFSGICLLKYLPRVKGWFGALKKQKRMENKQQNRIAIIIPARNESVVIDSLFDSLLKQTYQNFDCHVIVKDKDDKTIKLAKKVNGIIHIDKNQTCKGDCLDFCLKEILKTEGNKYDAYFICDADCILDQDCLKEMNNALLSNADIIQAKKVVKNYLSKKKGANSISSSCNGLIWTLIDDMGNRYKSDHHITNMTIGTGIMLSSKLVSRLGGWPYRKTLTEDIELMYDSAIKGFTTFYYSYALIYVEEATSHQMTNKRRTRWLTGVVDSKRLYNKELHELPSTKENRKNVYYTTALSVVYSYIGSLTLLCLGNLFLGLILMFANNSLFLNVFTYSLIDFGIIYLSFLIMTLFCILIDHKYIRLSFFKKILLLFVHPLFYMEYIWIIGKALIFKHNRGWEVIERVDFAEEKK